MGTWGTSIFSDDTAADIRDDYRDLITSGVTNEDAVARLQKQYLENSSELRDLVAPQFWLALALSQWKLGRLDDATKKRALQVIDSNKDLEVWRRLDASDADLRRREKVLASLRRQLVSPQPKPRKIRPRRRVISPYQVGDVIRFTLSSGRFVLFRITSVNESRSGQCPIAEVLDWIGIDVPSKDELANLRAKSRIRRRALESVNFARIALPPMPKEGFDEKRVTLICQGLPMPQVTSEGCTSYPWPYLERAIVEDFGLQ